ncbi:HAMP domain-containing protein [Burkholderiaceae bacterium DAT-1]|nr:HAMP domain-containing protein [Burkholderiaceae bacterium DAT-1]
MTKWLRRILPSDTILWRLAGLMAVTLAISFTSVVLLFGHTRQQLVASQLADNAADQLSDMEDMLDGLPVGKQRQWITLQGRPYVPHLALQNDPTLPLAGTPLSPISRAIIKQLKARLVGVGEAREAANNKQQLWVHVEMLGEPYWLVIPLGKSREFPTWEFAVSIAIFLLSTLAGAALFALWINKPLRRLGEAAGRLGRGEHLPPLEESGPLEVRQLSASFNHMREDLRSSESERDVMLAGISHDLRTPLARMKLGVELMHDDSLRDGMREDVEDIEHILTQFINFARGDTGEEAHLCDIKELLLGLIKRYERSGQFISLHCAPDIPLIYLKPLAIQRALSNLMDNAFKYGGNRVEVIAALDDGQLTLTIRDHGPGIPHDQIGDASKPFHRLDVSRRADGGSGLGLAIVERIARIHGGTLTLSNHAEGGLIVRIQMPARENAD